MHRTLTRRSTAAAMAGLALAPILPRPGRAASAALDQIGAAPPTGEFVGAVAATDRDPLFVAVVAGSPLGIGDGVNVRAYLCDGVRTSIWVVGEAAGAGFALTEIGGATIEGQFFGSVVRGTVSLADGAGAGFGANQTADVDGLYRVLVTDDRGAFGLSESGIAHAVASRDGETLTTFLFLDGEIAMS